MSGNTFITSSLHSVLWTWLKFLHDTFNWRLTHFFLYRYSGPREETKARRRGSVSAWHERARGSHRGLRDIVSARLLGRGPQSQAGLPHHTLTAQEDEGWQVSHNVLWAVLQNIYTTFVKSGFLRVVVLLQIDTLGKNILGILPLRESSIYSYSIKL